jgi:hypothetical protein
MGSDTDFVFPFSRHAVSWGTAFDDTRDKKILPIQTGMGENLIEDSAGAAHKGSSLKVLLLSWGLSNQHDPGPFRAFSRNRFLAVPMEVA